MVSERPGGWEIAGATNRLPAKGDMMEPLEKPDTRTPIQKAGYSKHWAQVQDRPRYKRAAVDKRRKRNQIARASRKASH